VNGDVNSFDLSQNMFQRKAFLNTVGLRDALYCGSHKYNDFGL
jgi:hypothetical protein